MKNKQRILFLLLFQVLSISCATVVKFELERPPLVDLRGKSKITVIPLEWTDQGSYNYLAGDVTRALASGVRRASFFHYVNPSVLRNMNSANYWQHVDVYITGRIVNVTREDTTERREETSGDEKVTKTYITRTVTVIVSYQYISAIDGEVLGVFDKTEIEQVTIDYTKKAGNFWGNLLTEVINSIVPSRRELSRKAVQGLSVNMYRELNPWTTKEVRRIQKSTTKDKRFNEAQKLVRRKRYLSALEIYKQLYEETGSIVAGFNSALLLQANGQFTDALELLNNLNERITTDGLLASLFITDEIKEVTNIIEELKILEDYRYQ